MSWGEPIYSRRHLFPNLDGTTTVFETDDTLTTLAKDIGKKLSPKELAFFIRLLSEELEGIL